MKKVFAWLLVLLFVVTGLAGCSQSPTAVPYDQVRMEEWEEMTLEYWCIGEAQHLDEEIEAAANEILKKHLPNTSVHFTWVSRKEFWDRTDRAFAADENIDILNDYVLADAVYAKQKARTGNFIDLSPYFDTYMADYAAHIGEDMRKWYQVDGKDYFFLTQSAKPSSFDTVEASVQLLTELGYDPQAWRSSIEQLAAETYRTPSLESEEKLLDFFEEYCEKLEQSGLYADDPFGSINVSAPHTIFQSKHFPDKVAAHYLGSYCEIPLFLIPLGADVNAKDFELEMAATSDWVKFYWQKAAEWYDRGWIREDIAKYYLLKFGEGNSQAFEHSQYEYGEPQYRKYKLDLNFHAKEADTYNLYQNIPNEELLVVGARMNPTDQKALRANSINGIPKTVKKDGGLERALIFQNFLYTEDCQEYYRTMLYGRENLEWKWNDDRKDDTSTITWYTKNITGDMHYYKGTHLFGTELNGLAESPAPLAEHLTIADYKEFAEKRKNAWVNPYQSFRLDLSDEKYASIFEKVAIIYDDYAVEFWNGSLGTAGFAKAYPEMEERLKKVGIDELKAEALRQLRAYAKEFQITTGWERGH